MSYQFYVPTRTLFGAGMLNELAEAGVETAVFDKVQANPLRSTVMTEAAFAKEHGCDFVVALGGGSVMDVSKAMAAMATNDSEIWDYQCGVLVEEKLLGKISQSKRREKKEWSRK